MTTRPFLGAGDIADFTALGIRPYTTQIAELTQKIRESINISDNEESGGDMDAWISVANESDSDLIKNAASATPSKDKTMLYTWGDDDTRKLIREISLESLNDLESKIGSITDPDERERHYRDIQRYLVDSNSGLFGGRGYANPQYIETSPEYAALEPLAQSAFKSVVKFEDLIKKNGKNRTHLNFKQERLQTYIEEFKEQELISQEVYDALQGRTTKFIDDGVQEEATMMMGSLIVKEPELTSTVLKTYADTSNFRTAIGYHVKAANPDDIRSGIFNNVAETLPISENIIRDQIQQDNQNSIRTAFATNTNLTNAVSDILGPIPPATDDEDKIEKNTRDRLLNYLETYRSNIRRDNPNYSDQEVGSLLYAALMDAQRPGPMGLDGFEDPSIIDNFRNIESDKVQVVKDEKAAKEYERLQKEQRSEQEKFIKEQQRIAKEQRAWEHNQLDADDKVYEAARKTPEGFREKYLEDPAYRGYADELMEKYKTQGRPIRDAQGDVVGYSEPMGMTPSGKFAFFPDITYRDQYTGDIVTIPHSEMNNHLDRMGDRLAYQLQSIYNQSPEDMFNAQTGAGIPSLPFDPMKFMPQTRKGDMYTTNAMGERIPLYPYADPNEMVGGQAFPSGSVSPEPVSRYDQELKFKDTVLPTPDSFLTTGQESYFDLGPTEQGPIPSPTEPVEPVSKSDFMALSEPEF